MRPHALPECSEGTQPPLYEVGEDHHVSCVYYDGSHDPTSITGEEREDRGYADGGTADTSANRPEEADDE